jgi:hypothetical protein
MAQDAAADFFQAVSERLKPAAEDKAAEALKAFEQQAREEGLEVRKTDFFTDDAKSVKPLTGRNAINKAFAVSTEKPLLDKPVRERGNTFSIICFLDHKPADLPQLSQENHELVVAIEEQIHQKNALEMARNKAEALRKEISEMGDELGADKLIEQMQFETLPQFTRNEPLKREIEHYNAITQITEQPLKENTILVPKNIDNGAILIYVQEKSMPPEEEVEEKKNTIRTDIGRQKESQVYQAYIERLQEESNTQGISSDLSLR